jgi:uncharacterized protein (DUF433 family)
MIDWTACPVAESVPEKLGGEWVFRGTRVPIRALIENVEGVASIDEFHEWFPGVERNQVKAVRRHIEANDVRR